MVYIYVYVIFVGELVAFPSTIMTGFNALCIEVVMASYPENNPFCRGKAQPAPAVQGS